MQAASIANRSDAVIWVRRNATEADSCVPDCSEDGRKRRNAEDDEDFVPAAGKQLNYVSLDYTMIADLPIQRKREHQLKKFLNALLLLKEV